MENIIKAIKYLADLIDSHRSYQHESPGFDNTCSRKITLKKKLKIL